MAESANGGAKILQTELEYLKVEKVKKVKNAKDLQQTATNSLKKSAKAKPVKALLIFLPENFKFTISGGKKLDSTGAKWTEVKKVLKSRPDSKTLVLIYTGNGKVPFYMATMRFKTEAGFNEVIERTKKKSTAEENDESAATKREETETYAVTGISEAGKDNDRDTNKIQEASAKSPVRKPTNVYKEVSLDQTPTSYSSSSTSTVRKSQSFRRSSLSPMSKSHRNSKEGLYQQESASLTPTNGHISRKSSIPSAPWTVRVSYISTDPQEQRSNENLLNKKEEPEERKPYKTTYITGDANKRSPRRHSIPHRSGKEHCHTEPSFSNYVPGKGIVCGPEGNTLLYSAQHRSQSRSSSISSRTSSSDSKSCCSKCLEEEKGSSNLRNERMESPSDSSSSEGSAVQVRPTASCSCNHDKCRCTKSRCPSCSRDAKTPTIRIIPLSKSRTTKHPTENRPRRRTASTESLSSTEDSLTTTTEYCLADFPFRSPPNLFLVKDEDLPRNKARHRTCSHGRSGAK